MIESSRREFRPVKRLVGGAAIGIGVLALATSGSGAPSRAVPQVGVGEVHQQLQVDTLMIEQMSTPNADTGRQNHLGDQQLDRSRDPGYLAALEQHQADIDRMLARR